MEAAQVEDNENGVSSSLSSLEKLLQMETPKRSMSMVDNLSLKSSQPSEAARSSADIPSDLIIFDEFEKGSRKTSEVGGWNHVHNLNNDQYLYEYTGETPEPRPDSQLAASLLDSELTSKKNESLLSNVQTVDHQMQTSRRPTVLSQSECKYGYHFPTSPTSSMISQLANAVQNVQQTRTKTLPAKQISVGKLKVAILDEEEEKLKRLKEMFPTATEPVIAQMIRIYHGREGLIKAALISLGYKRSKEYIGQAQNPQSPIMMMMSKPSSKKLFEKLAGYFPERDEAYLKGLMFKHKEVEHEIISAIVESGMEEAEKLKKSTGGLAQVPGRQDRSGVIMKLRYLKHLYPSCDEVELYHLLHCNNLNAQLVIEEIDKRGHQRANIDEVMQNRKSQAQQMRNQQAKGRVVSQTALVDPLEAHEKRVRPKVNEGRLNKLRDNLKARFPQIQDSLLLLALEATDFSEPLAAKFLESMPSIDEEQYKKRYRVPKEEEPRVVLFPCKGVQKCDVDFMSITGNGEYVAIPKETLECRTALALVKKDASTFTQEDFELARPTPARGRQEHLVAGSRYRWLASERRIAGLLARGASRQLRNGSQYGELCPASGASDRPIAHGPNSNNRSRLREGVDDLGLRRGPNPKLLERIHPFLIK